MINADGQQQAAAQEAPVIQASQIATKKPSARKKQVKVAQQQEDDLTDIGFFQEPKLVEDLWKEEKQVKIVAVYAKGNYSYALEKPDGSESNQLYSWGMGENYVLGSRDDDNQFRPYTVHPKMFDEMPVLMIGAGTQHVVVLTGDEKGKQVFPQFTQEVLEFKLPPPEPKPVPVKPEKKPRKQVGAAAADEDQEMKHPDEEEKEPANPPLS
jgi:Regulator of chromosome condensation (RCC1) repeat